MIRLTRFFVVVPLVLFACSVGDEGDPSPEPSDEAPDETAYSPYVCAFAPFTPEGECSLDRVCTASACLKLYGECDELGYSPEMYPIIVDGTCACYFHCDLGGGGGDEGGGGGGGGSECSEGADCDSPSDCGTGLCDSSDHCWCGGI